MYCGFEVHTVDMFFECHVKDFIGVHAEDDDAEIVIPGKGRVESGRVRIDVYKEGY